MDLGGVYSSQLPTTKDGQPDVSGMAAVDKAYKAQVKKYLNRVTVGQILDGLDKFYDDYRNRKILMSLGVSIVLDYISGKSEQEMTRLIETLRRLSQ